MDKESFRKIEMILRNASYFRSIFDEEDLLKVNTPNQTRLREYIETVYHALDKLSPEEMNLIKARYMIGESEYLTDGEVIQAMGIKRPEFTAVRRQAFDKLAELLQDDG